MTDYNDHICPDCGGVHADFSDEFVLSLQPTAAGKSSGYDDLQEAFLVAWLLSMAVRKPCEISSGSTVIATVNGTINPEGITREKLAIRLGVNYPQIDLYQLDVELYHLYKAYEVRTLVEFLPNTTIN